MKRFLLLAAVAMMSMGMMAIGNNSGSTKSNAIDFDWKTGNVHPGTGTLWYRVDLAPLYEEEDPSLSLYLTNPSRSESVHVHMKASVAGESEDREYTIAPHQYRSWTANASLLVRMRQEEIYLTLEADGEIKLSAKVFEAADLDETCKDAKVLKWNTETNQTKGYAAWWKVDLKNIKDTANYKKDAKVTITNIGTGPVDVKAGQSLDCPSSGLTKRNFTIAAGESVIDTIPQSMILSVQPDELYFSIENIAQPVKIKVEMIDQPAVPVISAEESFVDLHVIDTIKPLAAKTYYRIKVADMDSSAKYEPEFTYRNVGTTPAKVTVKMAFEVPAFGTTNTTYELAPGEEEIVVYKKNMLSGLEGVEYIYLLTEVTGDVNFYGRFKHVREGKACKTNIDFNWETGHTQEARTTQWYAIDVTEAKQDIKDLMVYIQNTGTASANVKASFAFSCPYIDLQEISRTISAGSTVSKKMAYSTYGMMSDTVWVGVETNQDIKFWVQALDAERKEADEACLKAVKFDWAKGAVHPANDTVWYKIGLDSVRETTNFPMVVVRNRNTDEKAVINGALSLECPDTIANQERSLTIAAGDVYSKQLSRNMFTNIKKDTIYLRVVSTQELALELRLTEEAAGASCNSAIDFKWGVGNDQAADANLWYAIDLKEAKEGNSDIKLTIQNKENKACTGSAWMAYTCPYESYQEVKFNLAAKGSKSKTLPHSMLETLSGDVIYIRLIGNTALHIEAKLVDPAPFDTITCEEINANLTELNWNTPYTQTVDTAWYLLKKEVLKVLEDSASVTAQAHIINTSGADNTIKAEVAYRCPVTATMMSKSVNIKNGQELAKIIERATVDQFTNKDTILIRLISKGSFQFSANLVSPYTGNDIQHALPVSMVGSISQEANTTMWYKINTAEWKADQTLHGKSLHFDTKNNGGDAHLKVAVYEDPAKLEDLLEDKGSRTIPAGKSASRNFPAYAVYGLADKTVYVKVTSDQPLTFTTLLKDYDALATPVKTKELAKLVVPNVDYTVEAGQEYWFAVCVPYIRNNYKMVDASNVIFTPTAPGKVTASFTWQDELTYKVPERTRMINRTTQVVKTFKEIVDEGLKRAGLKYSVAETKTDYIEELLRSFITSDSLTGYLYVKSEQKMTIRIQTPQTTGEACANPMDFDWEHGNVNPAGQETWYRVTIDSTRIPEGKDLRLHVENWSSENSVNANASLAFECGKPIRSLNYTIAAGEEKYKDIARDFLKKTGWTTTLFIDYNSDMTTHIWAELIPAQERDTVYGDVDTIVCPGDTVNGYVIYKDTVLSEVTGTDLENEIKAALYDSVTNTHVYVRKDPAKYDASSLISVKRGEVLDFSAAEAWLKEQYQSADNDTLKDVETFTWQYSTDGVTYSDVPAAPLASGRINLKYIAALECQGTVESDVFKFGVRDTLYDSFCQSYTWETEGRTYTEATFDSVIHSDPNLADSIAYLSLTKLPAATGDTTATACNQFKWHGVVYTNDTVVSETLKGQAYNGCDSIITLHLDIENPVVDNLEAVSKYGDRLIVINRNQMDSLFNLANVAYDDQKNFVFWHKITDKGDSVVCRGEFYLTNNGMPMSAGIYYAEVIISAAAANDCGWLGYTNKIVVGEHAGEAPALVPSLARPGEDIMIINLNPDETTAIRVYTSEGLLLGTYSTAGEAAYTIKAAADNGFYMVELTNDNMKSTLRYMVK